MNKNTLKIDVSVDGADESAGKLGKLSGKLGKVGEVMKTVAKEAAILGGAIGGAFGAAYKVVEESIDKYNAWNKELQKVAGSLRLTAGETQALEARLQALGTGELASIPGVFDDLALAARNYLESGGDLVNLETDLAAAYKFAEVNGENALETLEKGLGVTDAYNLANGQLENTLEKVKVAQLNTNKPIEELMRGLERGAGIANAYKFELDEMVSVTAGWASTGERATTMGTALVSIMDELAVDSFPALIEQLKRGRDGQIDIAEMSMQNQRYFGALSQQVDSIVSTYDDLNTGVGYVDASFRRFSKTTLAETTRAMNEYEAAQLQTGERMQELQPIIETMKLDIKLLAMEMAEWALKNPEMVVTIISGIMAIKTAFTALKASNPIGWVMAAVEGVIALGSFLSDVLVETIEETRDSIRANKQMLESQKADIDATRQQIRAKEGLTEQYINLTEKSYEYAGQIGELAVAEAQLTAAIAAREAAEEAGTERLEGALQRTLTQYQKTIRTQEDAAAAQEAINDAVSGLNDVLTGNATYHEVARDLLMDTLGITEAQADQYLEHVDSLEEVQSLIDAVSAGIDAQNVLMTEAGNIRSRELELVLDKAGILEQVRGTIEGNLDLTEAEQRVVTDSLLAEQAKARIIVEQAGARAEMVRLAIQEGRVTGNIAANLASLASATVDVAVGRLSAITAVLREYNQATGATEDDTDDTPAGTPASTSADKAAAAAKRAAEKTIESISDDFQRRWIQATDEGWDHYERRGKEAVAGVTKKAAEELAVQQNAMADLAGVFNGIFTDESFDFWSSFETLGRNTLDELAAYAALAGLFSLTGTGGITDFAPGGLAGGVLSLLGFAEGGRVTQPTVAMVGEGGAPEYIIPEPDMQAALTGGIPGVVDLLNSLGGNVQRAAAAPASSTTNVYNSYGLAVGSLDRLDAYNRRGESRRARRVY